jgi:hypothetical protein
MPKVALDDFIKAMQDRFPKLNSFDETRLFSVLMDAGVNIEFEYDESGNTQVSYGEISDETAKKLAQL